MHIFIATIYQIKNESFEIKIIASLLLTTGESRTIIIMYQTNEPTQQGNLNWCEYQQKNKPQGNAVATGIFPKNDRNFRC